MKPEVKAKVGDALVKLWSPIVYSFGIGEIDNDNNDGRRRVRRKYGYCPTLLTKLNQYFSMLGGPENIA